MNTKNDYKTSSDESLLQLIAQDNLEAYECFLLRHEARVLKYALKRLPNPELAEEATQIIFTQIYRKRWDYDPKYLGLQWLYVISRSEIKDLANKEKRHKQDHQSFEEYMSQTSAELPNDLQKDLDLLLEDIDEEDKELLINRALEGKSFAELASELGYSEANLRQRFHRLTKRLQLKWKNQND